MRGLVCVIALAGALAATGCLSSVHDVPPEAPARFPEGWRVIDLTRPLDWRAPSLPHPKSFPFERIVLEPEEGSTWRLGGFAMLEQMGTHLAAPAARGGASTVESIRARDLLLPVVVVDAAMGSPGGQVTEAMLRAHEVEFGLVPSGSIVLLRTGAGSAAPEDPRYAGKDKDGALLFAGWSPAAVRYLIEKRDVRALGTDAPAVDSAAAYADAPAQRAAAEAGLFCIANLGDLATVPRTGAYVVIGSLPIVGGSGAPCRVLAFIPPPRPRRTTEQRNGGR